MKGSIFNMYATNFKEEKLYGINLPSSITKKDKSMLKIYVANNVTNNITINLTKNLSESMDNILRNLIISIYKEN